MVTPRSLMREYGIIGRAAKYAKKKHKETNHKYDDVYPYKVHLKMVYHYAVKYRRLIIFKYDEEVLANAMAAAWTHDTIEDTRETFNNVRDATNVGVANITYALTNHKGKTRAQRAGKAYYRDIKEEPLADYIKICDRLANLKYSAETQSRMLDVYRKEHDHFRTMLYKPEYEMMFDEMEELMAELPENEVYYARQTAKRWKSLRQQVTFYKIVIFITTLLALLAYVITK